MLTKDGISTLSRAIEGLNRGDAAGWAALAPLTRIAAGGADVSIDFTTETTLGAPLVVVRPAAGPRLPDTLTARQREVAGALARGQSNKAIARDLGIAPSTVKDHVAAIMQAAGVARRAELAVYLHGGQSR